MTTAAAASDRGPRDAEAPDARQGRVPAPHRSTTRERRPARRRRSASRPRRRADEAMSAIPATDPTADPQQRAAPARSRWLGSPVEDPDGEFEEADRARARHRGRHAASSAGSSATTPGDETMTPRGRRPAPSRTAPGVAQPSSRSRSARRPALVGPAPRAPASRPSAAGRAPAGRPAEAARCSPSSPGAGPPARAPRRGSPADRRRLRPPGLARELGPFVEQADDPRSSASIRGAGAAARRSRLAAVGQPRRHRRRAIDSSAR